MLIIACFLQHFRQNNWAYVVAPYEADAQGPYLMKIGLVHFGASTDSDWGLNKDGMPVISYLYISSYFN